MTRLAEWIFCWLRGHRWDYDLKHTIRQCAVCSVIERRPEPTQEWRRDE